MSLYCVLRDRHKTQMSVLCFAVCAVISFFYILTAVIFPKVSALQYIGILGPYRRARIFLIQGIFDRLFLKIFLYSTK
jgi:hypothetical protein